MLSFWKHLSSWATTTHTEVLKNYDCKWSSTTTIQACKNTKHEQRFFFPKKLFQTLPSKHYEFKPTPYSAGLPRTCRFHIIDPADVAAYLSSEEAASTDVLCEFLEIQHAVVKSCVPSLEAWVGKKRFLIKIPAFICLCF